MADFLLKIAGHTAAIHSLFDSTRDYCRAYLSQEAPETTISITPRDLAFEQEALYQEALEEGLRPRTFTDPFLDRAAIQRKMAEFLLGKNILLFHGSAIAVDGQGYLFTADCGTGKSTHTRLWRQVFGPRAVMVNDDRPFLELTSTGVLLDGAPWSGKHGLDSNLTVPLKGICILQRGSENHIAPISPQSALPMLQKQAGLYASAAREDTHFSLIQSLSQQVELWQMACTKDPEAARIAHADMSK